MYIGQVGILIVSEKNPWAFLGVVFFASAYLCTYIPWVGVVGLSGICVAHISGFVTHMFFWLCRLFDTCWYVLPQADPNCQRFGWSLYLCTIRACKDRRPQGAVLCGMLSNLLQTRLFNCQTSAVWLWNIKMSVRHGLWSTFLMYSHQWFLFLTMNGNKPLGSPNGSPVGCTVVIPPVHFLTGSDGAAIITRDSSIDRSINCNTIPIVVLYLMIHENAGLTSTVS